MPFPNLTLATGRTNHSEGTGAPDNGINEFLHGWDLQAFQIDADFIDLEYIIPPGSSVTGASFVGLSGDSASLRINFTQGGADAITVVAKHVYSAAT